MSLSVAVAHQWYFMMARSVVSFIAVVVAVVVVVSLSAVAAAFNVAVAFFPLTVDVAGPS